MQLLLGAFTLDPVNGDLHAGDHPLDAMYIVLLLLHQCELRYIPYQKFDYFLFLHALPAPPECGSLKSLVFLFGRCIVQMHRSFFLPLLHALFPCHAFTSASIREARHPLHHPAIRTG